VESGDRTGADRLEEGWQHALDPSDAADQVEQIRAHRKWLRGFRPSLRRLFPGRRED